MSSSGLVRRGVCLVVAAPSGAGKSTITRALLDSEPGVSLSISATTRAPRAGERDGQHYHFRSPAAFDAMVQAGELLEWAEVFGRRYGTPRAPVVVTWRHREAGRASQPRQDFRAALVLYGVVVGWVYASVARRNR